MNRTLLYTAIVVDIASYNILTAIVVDVAQYILPLPQVLLFLRLSSLCVSLVLSFGRVPPCCPGVLSEGRVSLCVWCRGRGWVFCWLYPPLPYIFVCLRERSAVCLRVTGVSSSRNRSVGPLFACRSCALLCVCFLFRGLVPHLFLH